MGLAVVVGGLGEAGGDPGWAEDLRESLARVSEALVRSGLKPHDEPEDVERMSARVAYDSFPYSWLHYLRRVYAHVKADSKFVARPLPEDQDPGGDPVLEEEYGRERSHLLCHSDSEGFYVPQDFRALVFCDESECPGGPIGSSYRLIEELVEVAPALGITLSDGRLADPEADRINEDILSDEGLYRELAAWLMLYDAARFSIERGAAIVFS